MGSLGFRALGLGLRVLKFRAVGLRFRVGFGLRVLGVLVLV